MFDDYESVETQEVAEPVEETNEDLGAEETEIADQSSESVESGKTDRDSAFAEMRRAREEAEKEAREAREQYNALLAQQTARQNAINKLTGGRKNADLEAIAESVGLEVEEVIATLEEEEATERLKQENELLTQRINNIELERRLDSALVELEKLDPNLSEDDISKVLKFADSGLSIEDGYYAVKAREINTKATPPKEIGKLNQSKPLEKDFFTEKEVDAMSEAEQRANYQKIIRSMSRW